jgi:hypothetical protein
MRFPDPLYEYQTPGVVTFVEPSQPSKPMSDDEASIVDPTTTALKEKSSKSFKGVAVSQISLELRRLPR